MLNRLGYDVDTVATGEDAVKRYDEARQAGKPFHAVILDLTLREGIGGEETLRALKALDADVCAVCSSGQSREATAATALRQGFKAVLCKPFRFQDVADCVQRLLGPTPTP